MSVNASWYKKIGRTISEKISESNIGYGKAMQSWKGSWFYLEDKLEWKNELKMIKGCMQFTKIGMCEFMTDKSMEIGLQDMGGEGAMKEKYG